MIKIKNNKKAVSPVITTVLLILLALVLASIIFMWAKGFIGEQVSKFDKPIEDSCMDIKITPVLLENRVSISNSGNIAIYKLGIRVTDSVGNANIVEERDVRLVPSGSIEIDVSSLFSEGDKIDLIPILIGKSSRGSSVEFSCLKNTFVVE